MAVGMSYRKVRRSFGDKMRERMRVYYSLWCEMRLIGQLRDLRMMLSHLQESAASEEADDELSFHTET